MGYGLLQQGGNDATLCSLCSHYPVIRLAFSLPRGLDLPNFFHDINRPSASLPLPHFRAYAIAISMQQTGTARARLTQCIGSVLHYSYTWRPPAQHHPHIADSGSDAALAQALTDSHKCRRASSKRRLSLVAKVGPVSNRFGLGSQVRPVKRRSAEKSAHSLPLRLAAAVRSLTVLLTCCDKGGSGETRVSTSLQGPCKRCDCSGDVVSSA